MNKKGARSRTPLKSSNHSFHNNFSIFLLALSITCVSMVTRLKQYEEGSLEGLARTDAEFREVLPEGIDRTEEAYKREILRLRIENERLKKSYAVQMNEAGEQEYVRLKEKSSK